MVISSTPVSPFPQDRASLRGIELDGMLIWYGSSGTCIVCVNSRRCPVLKKGTRVVVDGLSDSPRIMRRI